MTEINPPTPLTAGFAAVLQACKADFLTAGDEESSLAQHGAAALDATGFPGWPPGLESAEAVIETFTGATDSVAALSDNQPFVSAWLPLVEWMNTTVRRQLAVHHVELDGNAYITASLTPTNELEGLAHMDDNTFTPTTSVSMVAIIGQLVGPRIATGTVRHDPVRPMSQVTFGDAVLEAFAADELDHCRCEPDQLVVFPQFGQIHAGPATQHVAQLSPSRQLLVMRAGIQPSLV